MSFDDINDANFDKVRYQALKASAGSGKTFNLAARFLALVLMGARTSQIVAITFTNKSAADMKEKIINSFLDLSNLPELLALISEISGLNQSEILARRDEMRDDFLKSNLKISTFDAFFGVILRSFALNAGLNADYEIDVNEEIQRFLDKKFVLQLKKLGFIDFAAHFLYAIDKKKSDLIALCEQNLPEFNISVKPNFEPVRAKIREFNATLKSLNATPNILKTFDENITPNEMVKKAIFAKKSLEDHRNLRKYVLQEPKLDEIFEQIRENLSEYFREFDRYELGQISQISKIYRESKKSANRTLNLLSFDDVAQIAGEILRDENSRDLLYFRLDDKITHLLIDEFQDTSARQYEILRPLIDEIVAGHGTNLGSFFYVGDVKQSIYRFRGSIKELFDFTAQNRAQIAIKTLDTNYRSDENLVNFINDKFANKFNNGEFALQKCGNPSQNGLNSGFIEVKNIELNDDDDERAVMSESVFKSVKKLLKLGINQNKIAILCRKNADIDAIKSRLNLAGIQTSGEGATRLFGINLVRAVLEFLKFLITNERLYGENARALLGLKFLPKMELKLSETPLSCVKFACKMLGISLGDKNILKLCEIASGYSNLVDFVFCDDKTPASLNENESIKVMTIHKSKGLEFDHVIVCDKMGGDSNKGEHFLTEYDLKSGQFLVMIRKQGRENIDEKYRALKEKKSDLDSQEALNLIYVALTRAKKSLFVLINPKNSYFTQHFKLQDETIGEIKNEENSSLNLQNLRAKKEIIIAKTGQQELVLRDDKDENLGENTHAINFGLALHFALEMMAKFDENSLNMAMQKCKNEFGQMLCESDFIDIKSRINMLIYNEKFKQIIDGVRLIKEQSFKRENELRRIDLLCIKDDEAIVIDYKSSYKFCEQHKIQVEFYKNSLEKMAKFKNVRAIIIYILSYKISFVEI